MGCEGRIQKALSGFYYVNTGAEVLTCRARGKFRKEGVSPLVGDQVEVRELELRFRRETCCWEVLSDSLETPEVRLPGEMQALVAFMAPWCDYVFASYVAFGYSDSYNVAVALQRWVWTNDYQGYFTRFCAGGVLVAIPVTVLFLCLQKYYVEGVTGGAVKG